ncbi:MAG: flotillin family protein, partial [Labilithrix sp.]|nr:flotillin family protein [Labilithrix sp.]
MLIAVIVVVVLALAAVSAAAIVQRLIHICQPNEVLVFSGARRREGARELGYRLVQGGRGIRIPLLETVDRLDLTNMIIDVRVEGAYSKGGIPLNVTAVANVKIASTEPVIGNAIERFLGKRRKVVEAVAKETLEGNLRGVLATLTPEEVNHDRVKFAQSLLHEADMDLKRLGLVLDTLKIQNVSDDKGYLNSLGRKQSAELQMRSRVAEAENRALSI